MSNTRWAAIWRGDGANTKPTASAPMAIASKASSSLVMPQILTNISDPQFDERADRVVRCYEDLANEHGCEARIPQTAGVSGVAYA